MGDAPPPSERDLVLRRTIGAPPEAVYHAWTQPDLLREWFAPLPWTTEAAELDLRPGGAFRVVMEGPHGAQVEAGGLYLAVERASRLVYTDAYEAGWRPSARPFMTVELTFEPCREGTLYTTAVRHWSVPDRVEHERMGFRHGWMLSTDQLAGLVEAD